MLVNKLPLASSTEGFWGIIRRQNIDFEEFKDLESSSDFTMN